MSQNNKHLILVISNMVVGGAVVYHAFTQEFHLMGIAMLVQLVILAVQLQVKGQEDISNFDS